MPKFIKEPDLRVYPPTDWKLITPLVYQSDLWKEQIVVPAGFVTDLASIPRIFRSIIPQNGKHRLAAIVHDYLCRQKDFHRLLADSIFLEAMKLLGVNRIRRRIMYWAVVLITLLKRKDND